MKISELLNSLEYSYLQGTDKEIAHVAYDSRKAAKDGLFVCVTGFKTDGHIYARQAVEAGATALLVQREIEDIDGFLKNITVVKVNDTRAALAVVAQNYYNNPAKKLNIIGVTGTNGKTSTTYLLASVLKQCGRKVGIIGTIGNMIGDAMLETEHTTPESLELHELFSKMLDAGVKDVVMEVSSHSLALHRVDGVQYKAAVFTNLTQDHLDFHKTMEDYLEAKARLFNQSEYGIFNADDLWSDRMIKLSSCKHIRYGVQNKTDISATNVKLDSHGCSFDAAIVESGEQMHIELSIPAEFSVYNALGVIGVAHVLGIPTEDIVSGLKATKGIPGRAQLIKSEKGFTVVVDYAHTPDGLSNVLKSVRGYCKGRVLTVFGCGGNRDKLKRPIMGEIAAALSDFVIITSDNPRHENPEGIIEDIEAGIAETASAGKYIKMVDRKEAIQYAISMAEPNDLVVVAGKGHENYQILGDKTIHFDDVEVISDALREI